MLEIQVKLNTRVKVFLLKNGETLARRGKKCTLFRESIGAKLDRGKLKQRRQSCKIAVVLYYLYSLERTEDQ